MQCNRPNADQTLSGESERRANEPRPPNPAQLETRAAMASDKAVKDTPEDVPAEKGIKIFCYPKIVFMYPTLLIALICGISMTLMGDRLEDPTSVKSREAKVADDAKKAELAKTKGLTEEKQAAAAQAKIIKRFNSPQNLLGVAFLAIFAFNIVVIAMDFPRFTLLAGVLLAIAVAFALLWIGAYYHVDVLDKIAGFLESIYVVANAQFYFLFATILVMSYIMIFTTRWLDYWEILPNEILHHHGPLSDLERYPTINVKVDKEIPDVLEYIMLRSGRLTLHIDSARKPIVLDNVLFINSVEEKLKNLMSRMEVRLAPDAAASLQKKL